LEPFPTPHGRRRIADTPPSPIRSSVTMGFRFRRSLKIAPGFRVNIGKRGFMSVSVGDRGFRSTFGKKGVRHTVGLLALGCRLRATPQPRGARRCLRTEPPTQEATSVAFTRALRVIGLQGVSHHVFRHTGATVMIANGISLRAVQTIGGWHRRAWSSGTRTSPTKSSCAPSGSRTLTPKGPQTGPQRSKTLPRNRDQKHKVSDSED
jgi:hypothetical protein